MSNKKVIVCLQSDVTGAIGRGFESVLKEADENGDEALICAAVEVVRRIAKELVATKLYEVEVEDEVEDEDTANASRHDAKTSVLEDCVCEECTCSPAEVSRRLNPAFN
jgi:hypothetical protein